MVNTLNVGEKIKTLRKSKKLTQSELAHKLDKSLRMIQKYESNEVLPSWDVLEKIASELDTSIGFFIDLIEDKLVEGVALVSYLESIGYEVQEDMNPLEWEVDSTGNKYPISFDESPDAPNCILIKDGIEIKLTNGQMNDLQRELRNYTGYQINQYKK